MRSLLDISTRDRIILVIFTPLIIFPSLCAVGALWRWRPEGILLQVVRVVALQGAMALLIVTVSMFIYALAKPRWAGWLLQRHLVTALLFVWVVSIALVVGLFFIVGSDAKSPSENDLPNEYHSQRMKLKIRYPSGWSVQRHPDGDHKLYLRLPDEALEQAVVQIAYNKLPEGVSYEELVKFSEKLFEENYPNGVVKSSVSKKINNRQMYVLRIAFGAETSPQMQKMVYYFKGRTSYSFAFAALADRFDKYEKGFDSVVGTFETDD